MENGASTVTSGAHQSIAPDPAATTRQAGPLLVRYRPDSQAAAHAEELLDRYSAVLDAVAEAIGARPDPTVRFVVDIVDPTEDDAPAAGPPAADGDAPLRLTYSPDQIPGGAELELATRALASYLGSPPAGARFWDRGLAGHLVGRVCPASAAAEASSRCRELLRDSLLPPLGELIAESGGRASTLPDCAAAAFASYLIGRRGLERYRQLLRNTRTEQADVFGRTYGRPLAVVDRDWRRHLEAAAQDDVPSTAETIRRLLPLARPYWPAGLTILALTLVNIAFSAALPLAFRFLIDNILGRRPLATAVPFVGPAGHVIPPGAGQIDALLHLTVFLGLLYLLSAAARLRTNVVTNRTGESFLLDLRTKVLDLLGRLPAAYFARVPVADINHRVIQDTATIQQALTGTLVPMVTSGLATVLYAALLVSLEPRLAFVALLGLPLLGLIYRVRRGRLRDAARERVRRMADLSGRVNEFTAAQALVKVYRAGPHLLRLLAGRLEIHRQLNTVHALESSRLGQLSGLVMHLLQIVVLLVGGYLVIVGQGSGMAAGTLVAFYVLMNQLFGPVTQFAAARQTLTGAGPSVERITELLGEPAEEDPPQAVELERLRDGIRLEAVSFAYAPGRPVLRDVDLFIPAGLIAAFVGPTGAGKSSLVQLLPRLYDPTLGRITWDGVDLRAARLASLRRQVVFVPQEPLVLSASVYENIRFGLEGIGERDVERAARQALAHDFIRKLPDGYDTLLGDRGTGLSGGQRQRVALARALLRQPSVLILDEATSALDATTQRAVMGQLRADDPRRTLIKIAHRLETVADADTIFVLEDGRLVERGPHAELLAQGGVYARLFRDQMGLLTAAGRPTVRQAARWLARIAPFSALPPAALDELAALIRTVERAAGEIIYSRGSPGDELFGIGSGRVDVLAPDAAGHEQVVNSLGVGTLLGTAAYFSGQPHETTVRAGTDVLLFALERAAYEAVLERAQAAGSPAA